MSSGRSIRALAKDAQLSVAEALKLLHASGYAYSSGEQLVARRSLPAVKTVLQRRGRVPDSLRIASHDVDAVNPPTAQVPSRADPAAQIVLAAPISIERRAKPKKADSNYDLKLVGRPASGIKYLDARAVLDIHNQLVIDFAKDDDPIDPPGVRDQGELLESAIGRPRTALGAKLKYPTIEMAAAALLHALVHDHPFHNGNKRTGIVAMLVFLDLNGYVLEAEEEDLFEYVLRLAGHDTNPEVAPYTPAVASDVETIHAAEWIKKHARKLNKAQQALKWRDLESILRGYGCEFELRDGNSVLIRRGSLHVHTGRRNAGDEMDGDGVAHVRRGLHLDEEHGVDSRAFYYNGAVVPSFINKYRKLLSRLASY